MKSTDIKIQKTITQLRTGYYTLNEYKHKTGLKDSPHCICGETESVRHYIEDCELYHDSVSEKLRVRLFQRGGIFEFKASVFLEVLKEDPYEQESINFMSVLENFIRETKIFEKKISKTTNILTTEPDTQAQKYCNVLASLYLQKIYQRRVDHLRDNTAKGLLTTTKTTTKSFVLAHLIYSLCY